MARHKRQVHAETAKSEKMGRKEFDKELVKSSLPICRAGSRLRGRGSSWSLRVATRQVRVV